MNGKASHRHTWWSLKCIHQTWLVKKCTHMWYDMQFNQTWLVKNVLTCDMIRKLIKPDWFKKYSHLRWYANYSNLIGYKSTHIWYDTHINQTWLVKKVLTSDMIRKLIKPDWLKKVLTSDMIRKLIKPDWLKQMHTKLDHIYIHSLLFQSEIVLLNNSYIIQIYKASANLSNSTVLPRAHTLFCVRYFLIFLIPLIM